MNQQPSNQWANIIQKQMIEKRQFDNQQQMQHLQRKQKYKEELETDMILKQQQKLIQHQQDQQLESQMLETLRQRESQKLKEMEQRKLKQIETSLENLNHLLIRKKMTQERSYQSLLLDQEELKQEKLKEMKSIERLRLMKEQDSRKLKENYDQMIQQKQNKQQQIKSQILKNQQTDPDYQIKKPDISRYQEELNKQIEEKQRLLQQLQQKKQEERERVEQKIAFEKKKMLENRLKDIQIYKQYENDNYELSKERKYNNNNNSNNNNNNNSLEVQNGYRQSQQKLPHIYSDNYQQLERNLQLNLIDQDLQKYQKLQQMQNNNNPVSNYNPMQNLHINIQRPPIQKSSTPIKTPLSQQSKSKQQKFINDGPKYSQIHQSKTQTPKSKQTKKSLSDINDTQLNPSKIQQNQYQSYNILTGVLQQK